VSVNSEFWEFALIMGFGPPAALEFGSRNDLPKKIVGQRYGAKRIQA